MYLMGRGQNFPYIGPGPLLALFLGRDHNYRQRIPQRSLCLIAFLGISLPKKFSTPSGVKTWAAQHSVHFSFLLDNFASRRLLTLFFCVDILVARTPAMNKVFKDLMSSVPTGEDSKQPPKDKGKFVEKKIIILERVEPLAVVPPSPIRPLGPRS